MSLFSQTTNCKEPSSPLDPPYISDDILLNCIARVSRLYYPTLSLVSKRFRSLVASPELYQTRTLLGCTESCLYLGVTVFPAHDLRWYTLCLRPTQNPNPTILGCFPLWFGKKKSSKNIAIYVPTRSYYPKFYGRLIAFGSNIYMIGGAYERSSRVFFMDCRSHTWYEAPSIRKPRLFPEVNVLDGKLFVMDEDEMDSIEFFNPKTEIWEDFSSPGAEISGEYIIESFVMNENLYLFGDKYVVYKAKENRWDAVEWNMDLSFTPFSSCVVDNVLYNYDYESSGKIKWYDFEMESWRVLKGLRKLPKLPKGENCVCLVNYGGKIAVSWEENGSSENMIWCAEIAIERGKSTKEDICGKVEWCSIVLTVPYHCSLEEIVAVTV